jgi:FAD/FMN-containing dehydrogenase
LTFRLHPLSTVVGGRLEYAGNGVREALRTFRDVVAGAREDLSCQAQLTLDESLTPAVTVVPCYTGPGDDPEGHGALRSAPGLVADEVGRHGFLDQQRVFDPGYGIDRNYWKSHFVRELPDELIDLLIDSIGALGRPPGGILIESLHGVSQKIDPNSAALGYRGAAFNVSAMAAWTDPALDEQHIAWARDTAAAVEPWAVSGGYANYMQADEPLERVRAAFGADSFDRLRAVKTRYDPNNILHKNQNIPPL